MKYEIHAGIKGSNIKFKNSLEFKNDEEALKYAEACAYELYYLNSPIDILEIEKELDVCEDCAEILFTMKMLNSITYSIKEIVEDDLGE